MAARTRCVEEGTTLERQFPHLYAQLLEAKDRVESHFGDVCEIDFTIQEGRLFIVGVRIGKRTPRANLRFLLQFLSERKIGIRDVLSRVTIADVQAFLKPEISNIEALVPLGRGLPACNGAATGEMVLDTSVACDRARAGRKILLVKEEVNPEDIQAMQASEGVVTARGGMTSHAAIACRGWGIPCVVGFGDMRVRRDAGTVRIGDGQILRQGEWITIDGASGRVYSGQGDVAVRAWQDCPELRELASAIDLGLLTDEVPDEAIGRVWRIRDCFAHSVPLTLLSTSKKPSTSRPFVSFSRPSRISVEEARAHAVCIRDEVRESYTEILLSFSGTLSRLLASAIGLGKHHLYFRPLWDPKEWVTIGEEGRRTQFVGFEYFGINRHIAHLVDVATVTFLLDLQVNNPADESFLDFTNPNGESLVLAPAQASAFTLLVNDADVSYEDLPSVYHAIRRREYMWRFYEANDTSHEEIMAFLTNGAPHAGSAHSLSRLCHHLGLLCDGRLTATGRSLIGQCSRKREYEYVRAE